MLKILFIVVAVLCFFGEGFKGVVQRAFNSVPWELRKWGWDSGRGSFGWNWEVRRRALTNMAMFYPLHPHTLKIMNHRLKDETDVDCLRVIKTYISEINSRATEAHMTPAQLCKMWVDSKRG